MSALSALGDPALVLVCERVFALAGETRELADQDGFEWCVGTTCLVEHIADLRTVGVATTFGFVDLLTDDDVAAPIGEVTQSTKVGRDGEVDSLAVAGNSGLQGGRRSFVSLRVVRGSILLRSGWD